METVLLKACPSENVEAVFGLMFLFFIIFIIFFGVALNILYVIAFCKIFSKAGYNWALGLLMLVPFASIIIPLYLGFAKWPIEKPKQPALKPQV
jgi:magnesium-transporting ATPase (P-type)